MVNEEKQQKPLSIKWDWDYAERASNVTTVVQGVVPVVQGAIALLTSILVSGGSSPLQSVTQTPATPPPQPAPQIIIKIDELRVTINQLGMSEDKETLSKVKQVISELQQLILDKTNELNQSKAQLLLAEDTLRLKPEQLQAKAEIENNIEQLQVEIPKLDEIQQRIEASLEAIVWLDPATKQEFLTALAEAAGDTALVAHPELKNPGGVATSPENIHQFYGDIEDFLFLIHRCLIVCRPNLLDRALAEKKLPKAPLPTSAYVTAFKFIRDQKVPDAISSQAAKEELTVYLNYLIKILS